MTAVEGMRSSCWVMHGATHVEGTYTCLLFVSLFFICRRYDNRRRGRCYRPDPDSLRDADGVEGEPRVSVWAWRMALSSLFFSDFPDLKEQTRLKRSDKSDKRWMIRSDDELIPSEASDQNRNDLHLFTIIITRQKLLLEPRW